jgi:hypothetical protein
LKHKLERQEATNDEDGEEPDDGNLIMVVNGTITSLTTI